MCHLKIKKKWIEQQLINEKSLGGELVYKVQFLGQRITDIETYSPSILTKDKLVKFISSGKSSNVQKMALNVDNEVYGFVRGGRIYLNPDLMNTNAAVHEYTHLRDAYTMRANPELRGKGLEILKDTSCWNEVISDPNYQDIRDDDDLVLSEIHARISGGLAEKVLRRMAELDGEQTQMDAADWNRECRDYIYNELHNDVKRSMDKGGTSFTDSRDFLATPMKDLFAGKDIRLDSVLSEPECMLGDGPDSSPSPVKPSMHKEADGDRLNFWLNT